MYKLVSFGEMLWDNLPTGRVPGGAPMNIALHMQSFGHQSALISKIGNDEAGENLLSFLKEHEAVTQYIEKDTSLPTGSVDVVQSGTENQFYRIAEPVAWDNIQLSEANLELVKNAKMFMYGTLASRSEVSKATLFELLEVANTKVFSVNLRPPHFTWGFVEELLHKSDIVKLNKTEFRDLLHWLGKGHYLDKDGFEFLRERFELDTILVSLGRNGAIMNRRGEFYQRTGIDIEIVDKVGCGNAFLSAYLHARAIKKNPQERLTYAIACGALAATHAGAAYHITSDMLEQFIEEKMAVKPA